MMERARLTKPYILAPSSNKEYRNTKIEYSNGLVYFADREHLYSFNLTDVSSAPVSAEKYAAQLQNLSQEQLNQISNSSVLDND